MMIQPHKPKHASIIKNKIAKYISFTDRCWILCDEQYSEIDMPRILKKIMVVHIFTFTCTNSKNPKLLKQISDVKWTQLKICNFGHNCIMTIEPICRISAPQLTHLFLNHNQFTSIQSLRKTGFLNLQHLSLNRNNIFLIEKMFESSFKCVKYLNLKNNYKIYSVYEMMKLESSLESLNLENNKIIRTFRSKQGIFNKNFKFTKLKSFKI